MLMNNVNSLAYIDHIEAALVDAPPILSANWETTPAAVLMPLYFKNGEWHLVYTKRTATLSKHSGQVAFPGGRVDPEDGTREVTALREAHEEIGLAPDHVRVIGTLGEMWTITNYTVLPVVGVIPYPYSFVPNEAEVAAIFDAPLSWLSNLDNIQAEMREIPMFKEPQPVHSFAPRAGHVIWGATAAMTVAFLHQIGLFKELPRPTQTP